MLHRELSDYPESAYTRCRKCGFMLNSVQFPRVSEGSKQGTGVDLSTNTFTTTAQVMDGGHITHYTDTTGEGSGGISVEDDTGLLLESGESLLLESGEDLPTEGAVSETTATRVNPTVVAGCPFCGTLSY